jgi:LPS export ABC transporter protein LptC
MHRLIPLLFLFVVALLVTSCENDIKVVQSFAPKPELPMRSAKQAELLYSDSAKVKVWLKAKVLDQYIGADPRIIMPRGVEIKFYNDSLRETTTLTADSAIRKERDNVMEARKHVIVINRKGETLRTEKLIWDERKRIIYTDVHVTITTANDEIMQGEGLEANEDFTRYKIKKPVGARTTPGDEDSPVPK